MASTISVELSTFPKRKINKMQREKKLRQQKDTLKKRGPSS
jgi:hypothetical protein